VTSRDHAACLDEDPELFFPIGNGDPAFRQIEKAKSSAVAVRSLRSAWVGPWSPRQDDGVWSGLSADERRALKRRDARARRADPVAPLLWWIRWTWSTRDGAGSVKRTQHIWLTARMCWWPSQPRSTDQVFAGEWVPFWSGRCREGV